MNEQSSPRGYIVETGDVPAGALGALERGGLAWFAARTIDGVYLEPAVSLARVLAAIEREGVRVLSVRPAWNARTANPVARPSGELRARLRSMHAAEWLPTLTIA